MFLQKGFDFAKPDRKHICSILKSNFKLFRRTKASLATESHVSLYFIVKNQNKTYEKKENRISLIGRGR